MNLFHLALFQSGALVLLWSCFCRASYTHKGNTKRSVRWVFTVLGVVAGLAVFAVPLGGYQPDGMAAALVAVCALVQVVTSHHWRHGVPPQFRKGSA